MNRIDQDTFEHMQAKDLRFQKIYLTRDFPLPYDKYSKDLNSDDSLSANGYANWNTYHSAIMFDNIEFIYNRIQGWLRVNVDTQNHIRVDHVFQLSKLMRWLAAYYPELRNGARISSIRFDELAFNEIQEHVKENRYAMNEALDKDESEYNKEKVKLNDN